MLAHCHLRTMTDDQFCSPINLGFQCIFPEHVVDGSRGSTAEDDGFTAMPRQRAHPD